MDISTLPSYFIPCVAYHREEVIEGLRVSQYGLAVKLVDQERATSILERLKGIGLIVDHSILGQGSYAVNIEADGTRRRVWASSPSTNPNHTNVAIFKVTI